MMKLKHFVLLLFILGGCAKVPTYQSNLAPDEETGRAGKTYSFYDKSSGIAYGLMNDDKAFYITFNTSDYLTKMKILRNGLSIAIDTTGKKEGENIYFMYPITADGPRMKEKEFAKSMGSGGPGSNMAQLIDAIPRDAIFHIGGENNPINVDTDPDGFYGKISMDEVGVLYYTVAIPFDKISSTPVAEMDKLSVAILSKGFKVTSKGGAPAGSTMPMGGGSRRPGAGNQMQGNGMSGAMGGAAMGGAMQTSTAPSGLSDAVKIWFKPVFAQ